MFYTPLMGINLASALDIGLRLFGSNKKLVPQDILKGVIWDFSFFREKMPI